MDNLSPPPPLAPSSYYVWDSTTIVSDQSLGACQPTSNIQESFAFADYGLSNNQLLRPGLVSGPGYLEVDPDYTLSGAFAVATTNPHCSYSSSSQQTDLDSATQLSPPYRSNSFENHESSEQSVDGVFYHEIISCATDTVQTNESTPPPPTQIKDFPACMLLEQSAVATTYSHCSYPASNQQFIPADPDNALQLSPLSNISSTSTLWEQIPDVAPVSEYPRVINKQATLTDLGSSLQPGYTDIFAQNVLHKDVITSSIVLPLSLGSTEYPTLAQLPHNTPVAIQNPKRMKKRSSRPIPCPGCRMRKIRVCLYLRL